MKNINGMLNTQRILEIFISFIVFYFITYHVNREFSFIMYSMTYLMFGHYLIYYRNKFIFYLNSFLYVLFWTGELNYEFRYVDLSIVVLTGAATLFLGWVEKLKQR